VLRADVNPKTTQAKALSHYAPPLEAGDLSGTTDMEDDGFLIRADPSSVEVASCIADFSVNIPPQDDRSVQSLQPVTLNM